MSSTDTTPGAAPTTSAPPASTGTELLTATSLEKSFSHGIWPRRHRQPVLRGADLSLHPGEVVGLVGENGSGKSTLMKILVGALRADVGGAKRTGTLGYCPQEPQVYPRLTCDEHVELFAAAYGISQQQAATSRQALYKTLGFARYGGTRADQLSGGTLAKLNLSLALLADPNVLLLDEPYAGFDWDTYLKFWTIVAERRAADRTVLIVSHFVVDHDRFDRIIEIKDGLAVAR